MDHSRRFVKNRPHEIVDEYSTNTRQIAPIFQIVLRNLIFKFCSIFLAHEAVANCKSSRPNSDRSWIGRATFELVNPSACFILSAPLKRVTSALYLSRLQFVLSLNTDNQTNPLVKVENC